MSSRGQSPGLSWQQHGGGTAPGVVDVQPVQSVLHEGDSFLVALESSFSGTQALRSLSFEFRAEPGFDRSDQFVPDAFEASLLERGGNPLGPPWKNAATSFFNIQEDGTVHLGPRTTFSGGVVTLDLVGVMIPEGATLFFDLIGGDHDNGSGVTIANITIQGANEPPVAVAGGPYSVTEGGSVALSASGTTDPDQDPATLTYEWDFDADGVFGETGPTAVRGDEIGVTPTFSGAGLDGPSNVTVTLRVTDAGNLSGEDTAMIDVTNVGPTVTAALPATQAVQYSDPIVPIGIEATDESIDVLTAQTTWSSNGVDFVAGLPAGLSLSSSTCLAAGSSQTCTWSISGNVGVPAGSYTIGIEVSDDDAASNATTAVINVSPEDASVAFDDANPLTLQVASAGGNSGAFTIRTLVRERQPDQSATLPAAPGDISLAVVSMTLMPIGPGSSVSGTCSPVGVTGTGYDAVLTVACSFNNVPVNTYGVEVVVNTAGYYVGSGDSVLVVFDPSLGFTTGGCWFYWPGTADSSIGYPGDRTNAGFNAKYQGRNNVNGNLLVIRHLRDGSIYRFKSNAMTGLSVGESRTPPALGWATITGKGTYREPGWSDPIGNYTFTAYVEDRGEPGTSDRYWLEVKDRDRIVEPDLSMAQTATLNAVTIQGGNIVVPHASSGK